MMRFVGDREGVEVIGIVLRPDDVSALLDGEATQIDLHGLMVHTGRGEWVPKPLVLVLSYDEGVLTQRLMRKAHGDGAAVYVIPPGSKIPS